MFFPKQTKFKKQFKGTLKGKTFKGQKIIFGNFALKSLENARITSKQIESARKVLTRKMKRLGKLWIRIFPDTPITQKPTETRMGKGKGSVSFWVAKIKKGQILFEINGFSKEDSKKILQSGTNKLPVQTKFYVK